MTPGERAKADQLIEKAIQRTLMLNEDLQHLDEVEAIQVLAQGLLDQGLDRRSLATSTAAFAVRLYRRINP